MQPSFPAAPILKLLWSHVALMPWGSGVLWHLRHFLRRSRLLRSASIVFVCPPPLPCLDDQHLSDQDNNVQRALQTIIKDCSALPSCFEAFFNFFCNLSNFHRIYFSSYMLNVWISTWCTSWYKTPHNWSDHLRPRQSHRAKAENKNILSIN